MRRVSRVNAQMPLPLIRTDRLLLDPWARADLEALHALLCEPEVRRFLWDDRIIARATAEALIDAHLHTQRELHLGYWMVRVPSSKATAVPALAGFCGFRPIDAEPDIELVYALSARYRGAGLATEACRAVLDYLWQSTSYARVYARTDPPNQRSVAMMVRLGMQHVSSSATGIRYELRRPAVRDEQRSGAR